MTQLALPQSIDAGTAIVASEVQSNFVATRDIINGQLEGGVGQNLKAEGVTMREMQREVLRYGGANSALQAGVYGAGDFKVTPGAGLALNYAAGRAFIYDDGSVHSVTTLLPAAVAAGGSVVIAANASGNPRFDRVVLTLTGMDSGTVSVVQGTPTVGATLDNFLGAPAIPAKSLQLANILVPSGFAGPFVQATHIRDRRSWARGAFAVQAYSSGNVALGVGTTFSVAGGALDSRLELTGVPVRIAWYGNVQHTVNDFNFTLGVQMNSASIGLEAVRHVAIAAGAVPINVIGVVTPAAGSHFFRTYVGNGSGTLTLFGTAINPMYVVIEEILRGNGVNSGA